MTDFVLDQAAKCRLHTSSGAGVCFETVAPAPRAIMCAAIRDGREYPQCFCTLEQFERFLFTL